jgi:MFS family permease
MFFILVFSMLNQWIRWLPVYLSSVYLGQCYDSCKGVSFSPICEECVVGDDRCTLCRECKIENNYEFYNLEDGICMTTEQYGVITGIAFAVSFCTFGLFAGYFVDRVQGWGATILGTSMFLQGLLTLLASGCSSFNQLLLIRVSLGILQAFGAPTSVYLITTYFPHSSQRPTANAAYTVGLYLGAGLSSLSSLIAAKHGWQFTMEMVGLLAITAAVVYELSVDVYISLSRHRHDGLSDGNDLEKDPLISGGFNAGEMIDDTSSIGFADDEAEEDGQDTLDHCVVPRNMRATATRRGKTFRSGTVHDDTERPTLNSMSIIESIPRFFKSIFRIYFHGPIPVAVPVLYCASCIRFVAGVAVFVYTPVLVARKFPEQSSIFSVFNAFVVLSCGSLSAFVGGVVGNFSTKRFGLASLAKLTVLSCLASMGPLVLAFRADGFWTAMSYLALGYLLGEAWMGLSLAMLQALSPPGGQGLAMSIYLFLNWNFSALCTGMYRNFSSSVQTCLICESVSTTMVGCNILLFPRNS